MFGYIVNALEHQQKRFVPPFLKIA